LASLNAGCGWGFKVNPAAFLYIVVEQLGLLIDERHEV
jgi:hypothetical protein